MLATSGNLSPACEVRFMNAYRHPLGLLAIFSSFALTNCGSRGGAGSPHISISPKPATIAVNSTVTFTATLSGDNNNTPRWYLLTPYCSSLGSPVEQTGGSTFVYTAPAAPPTCTNNMNSAAGTVELVAEIGYSGMTISGGGDGVTFTITAPSVTVGITPMTASVALGSTQTFYGYAVGSVNRLMTAQVNGVTGGSTATGTIAQALEPGTYTYTAPTSMPMTGNTVSVTIISQADPSKTQTAVVTLH
jgi:hypothetical protein